MSLKEFMLELETELKELPLQRREEILEDFDAQIKKAIELGDTEDHLLKILGDPRKVAEKFIAEEAVVEKREPKPELKVEVNAAIQPVTGDTASEIREYNIEALTINGEMLDIIIETGSKFSIKFLSYTHKGHIDYQVDKNTLRFFHSGAKEKVKFDTIVDFVKKRKQLKKDELTIIWPSALDELNVNNKNGKVVINNIQAEEFKIKTNEGPIECMKLDSNYGDFRSLMGSLKIEKSHFKNLHMKTEMGKIHLAGVQSERYNLVTELGKITLSDLTPDSDMTAISKMGSVNVNYSQQPKHTKIVASANVGKVKNALPDEKIEKQLYRAEYKSEMGAVKITMN